MSCVKFIAINTRYGIVNLTFNAKCCIIMSKSNDKDFNMANKNKLSIYLVKAGLFEKEDIFEKPEEIDIFTTLTDGSPVYYIPSDVHKPSWLKSFFLQDGNNDMWQANSRVVLIKRINIDNEEKVFALTFGYARFLFKTNVLEEQFGLRIVLNTIKQNELRKISKTSVGTNQKQSDEQLPKNSDISEFGFDINRDLMKNVSGKSEDEVFEKSMLTGGDIFSLTVSRDISNLDEFLEYCYRRYKDTSYQDRFSWIDNIKYVRDKSLVEKLDSKLIEEINNENFTQVWMAVPEVVDWEDIKDFSISNDSTHYNDIEIDKVIASLRNPLTNISQLMSKTIKAISSRDDNESIYEWKAYNCIVAEISLDNCEYCLSNGKWYKINNNFATDINRQYNEIDLFGETFIDYDHADEDAYNSALVGSLDSSLLLHTYKITTGGQGNNIEPCDVFWNNKIIHIKRNGGSSLLSHLFNQALVSSQMWLDASARQQLKNKMREKGWPNIIPDRFNSSDYEIVLAIINKFTDERPKIPFFSKVAICFTVKNITNFGFKVSLKNITNKK